MSIRQRHRFWSPLPRLYTSFCHVSHWMGLQGEGQFKSHSIFFSDIKRRTHNGIRSSSGESVVIGSFASLSGYVFSLLSFFFVQRERSSNHKPRFDSKVLLLKIRFRRCVYFKNNAMVFHLLRKPLYRLLLYGSPSWCVDVGGNFFHSKTHELKWSIYIDLRGMQLWPWWVAPDISHTMFFGELNLF